MKKENRLTSDLRRDSYASELRRIAHPSPSATTTTTTGVPLIYDVRSKCIRLLDDGSGETDPLVRYNFGSNGHLLFQPCQLRQDA